MQPIKIITKFFHKSFNLLGYKARMGDLEIKTEPNPNAEPLVIPLGGLHGKNKVNFQFHG